MEQNNIQKESLWKPNFLLLWQGQFVSTMGDIVYEVALGFWILAVTGSTALMGTLMAASTLPRIIISPFAGVVVDRIDRKQLMILMDIIRGVFIVLVGISALTGFIQIWMVFTVGVILGICGAFYSPGVNSVIPDIVDPSKLMSANSAFGMIQSGSSILGNSVGGFIYQVFGAPIMFLFNGISYIVSSFALFFIKIPKTHRVVEQHFWADMKEGYSFVWSFRGLRYLLIIASLLNFLSSVAIVLFLPLFQQTENLGPGRYGIAMALVTTGMFCGMIITSVIKIPPSLRMKIFVLGFLVSSVCFATAGQILLYPVLLIVLFFGGIGLAITNVFIHSTIQLTVPQDKRGKVFSLIQMVSQGLTPIAMAIGGVLGEFIPIRLIITSCFTLQMIGFIPFLFFVPFIRFIKFDPAKETVVDIM